MNLPEKMTHNRFSYFNDMILPFCLFLEENDIWQDDNDPDWQPIRIPEYMYIPPQNQAKNEKAIKEKTSILDWLYIKFCS